MKKTIQRVFFILLVIGVIVSAVLLVRHRRSELANLAPPDIRPVPVQIKTVETGRLPIMEHYLGTIAPVAEAVLSAQTTGYIIAMHKDVGDRVTAGEPAAQIDNRLAVRRKNALAAELAGAREDVKIKKIIRDRRQQLVADKAVSKESFDQAVLDHALAVSRVQRLEQEIEAAAVSLSFVSIQSFFDGVVTERMKDPGDLVMPGTPVYKVEDTRQGYKIMVHLPPEVAAAVFPDAPLRLISGKNVMDATVYRVHPSITNGNLAALEIRVPQRPFQLPTYATVGVDVVTGVAKGFLVDADCILEQETGAFVFIIQDKGQGNKTVRPVPVEVLGRHQDQAIVQGDVSSGMMLAAGAESMLLQLSRHGRVAPISGKTQ